jgi:hypothetical protein
LRLAFRQDVPRLLFNNSEGKAFMKADEAFMDKRVELYLACARTQKARVGQRKHAYNGVSWDWDCGGGRY